MKKPSDNSYDAEIYAVPKLYKPKKTKVNTLNLYNKMLSLKTQPMLKRFAYKNNINNINKTNITVVPNSTNNILYINAWILLKDNNLRPRNYGDDINYSFLSELITLQIKLYNKAINKINYLFIGSVLIDKYIDNNTIIWGSGMLKAKTIINKPLKVCAVRGPKTREILLKSNINCPEIYGDPAFLIPYFYYPYIKKQYKLGIIPHHSHINKALLNKNFKNKNIKIINFVKYTDWKAVIKEILSCEFICSESLHGLIISEAYKIPNIRISFGELKQEFKYEDYYLSIGKPILKPYLITNNTTYDTLMQLQKTYNNTFNLNLKNLYNACPIKLNNINMNNTIKPYTGKVLLCCIAKLENLYIKEFVEYYKKLGFDNICLYDNNDEDGEHFEDVINDYIESGYVILKNVRGMKEALMPCYAKCYNEYKNQYDWIAFFDLDEFLHIDNNKNIKQFLSEDMYNDRGINCIRVCWKQFDDSNILKTNGDYSVKKFKTYLPITIKTAAQSKPIIKTVVDIKEFSSAHGPVSNNDVKCVNTAGELCSNAITINKITWKNACLHHYRFKTIEEFVLQKMVRLWPTHYLKGGLKGLNLELFFRYNKKTPEKVKYAEALIKKYNINRNE